jgi:uncharacterized protein YndB with AHSA1/START domain
MSTAPERQAIRVEYDLAQPPPKVWQALTESDLLGRWLMPNDIKAQVGHRFTFKTAPALGFDGVVHCKVLEVEEPHRLAYSWRGGQIDTVVTWSLQPTASGTKLKLAQDGFGPEDGFTYQMLEQGWREKSADALTKVTAGLI